MMNKIFIKILLVLGVGAVMVSCVNQAEYSKQFNDKQLERVKTSAAFDLSCAAGEVTTIALEKDSYGDATRIGASGCDKKVTYTRINNKDGTVSWKLASAAM